MSAQILVVDDDPSIRGLRDRAFGRHGVPLLGKMDDLELVVDAVRIALLHPPIH